MLDSEHFRKKHDGNDLSVFMDFRDMVMKYRDTEMVKTLWDTFPSASWTRACGFLVEEMEQKQMFDMLQMFWDHDMFRMGGHNRAESIIKTLQKSD